MSSAGSVHVIAAASTVAVAGHSAAFRGKAASDTLAGHLHESVGAEAARCCETQRVAAEDVQRRHDDRSRRRRRREDELRASTHAGRVSRSCVSVHTVSRTHPVPSLSISFAAPTSTSRSPWLYVSQQFKALIQLSSAAGHAHLHAVCVRPHGRLDLWPRPLQVARRHQATGCLDVRCQALCQLTLVHHICPVLRSCRQRRIITCCHRDRCCDGSHACWKLCLPDQLLQPCSTHSP